MKSLGSPKGYSELVEGCSEAQREYLYFRVMGMGGTEARRVGGRRYNTLVKWENDEEFLALEEYLVSHRAVYAAQADMEMNVGINLKLKVLINDMLDRGIHEWKRLSDVEKKSVMRVMDSVMQAKVAAHGRGGEGESYEEKIKKLRAING